MDAIAHTAPHERLRLYLRRATAQHHARVEALVDIETATASLTAYVALLRRLLGFYLPLEACLVGTSYAGDLPFEIVRRAPRIERDLRDLDRKTSAIAAVPMCHELPALDSLARVAGCLYVIEGAALGGRVIARRVRDRLGLVTTGQAFFEGTGDLAPRWSAVLRWLDSIEARGVDRDAVVAGARATFTAFARWLEHAG